MQTICGIWLNTNINIDFSYLLFLYIFQQERMKSASMCLNCQACSSTVTETTSTFPSPLNHPNTTNNYGSIGSSRTPGIGFKPPTIILRGDADIPDWNCMAGPNPSARNIIGIPARVGISRNGVTVQTAWENRMRDTAIDIPSYINDSDVERELFKCLGIISVLCLMIVFISMLIFLSQIWRKYFMNIYTL